jgi:hypothetical protein
MKILEILMKKRDDIFNEIRQIKTMRRGTINEQYLKVPQKDSEPILRGPYYVLSKSVDGKTKSQRIKSKDLESTKKDVDAYNKFIKLTDEIVEITEQITDITRSSETEDKLKKK